VPAIITFTADRLYLAANDVSAGGLIFEEQTVNGAPGVGIRDIRIGDLTVNTLQVLDSAVTVPGYVVTGSPTSTSSSSVWSTFITDVVNFSGVAGNVIAVETFLEVAVNGTSSAVDMRLQRNGATIFQFVSPNAFRRHNKVHTDEFVAAGGAQSVTYTWQLKSQNNGQSVNVAGGAIYNRILYKR
jgi:hypothetical protein